MLYMIVESFRNGAVPVYQRFREQGRMLPDGLTYIDSWVSEDMTRCYQVMSSDDPVLLNSWMAKWDDLVSFEVVPLMNSIEAQNMISDVDPVLTSPRTC